MENIFLVLYFFVFLKVFLFWLWLWQIKEYHIGRFLAHFKEGQAFTKIISCVWRLKRPKFTKKIAVIFLTGVALAILTLRYDPSQFAGFYIFTLIVLVPLFFQFITFLWRKRLMKKAAQKRAQFPNLLVIGITGSYGKTSTKEFLYTILASKGTLRGGVGASGSKVLKTKEHQNSEVGIARCILNELKPEHEIFIVEMGAYNKGGIKMLCDIAKPKIGILTGINEQHMATFGSQEDIIKTKYELIESLPADGVAFFNTKNKYCVELYNKTKIKKFLYGQDAKIFGEENMLGAIAAAKELGATMEAEPPYNFLSVKRGIDGLNIIDSTYSANPTGVIAHLEYLKTLPGKKIIVMPCLIELGKASKEAHRRIGAKIAEVCDLAIITTKDRFKEIQEGLGNTTRTVLVVLERPKDILEKIKSTTTVGDIVLLESRVPRELINNLLNV